MPLSDVLHGLLDTTTALVTLVRDRLPEKSSSQQAVEDLGGASLVSVIPELPGVGRLGRHIEHDPRSRAFEVPRTVSRIRSIAHPRHVPIFDQGNVGSCTGNALAGAAMTGPLYQAGEALLAEADAVALYARATELDAIPGDYAHGDDTGSTGLAVAKAARERGLIDGYHHAFTLDSALAALSHGPVIIGIDWFAGFDKPVGTAAELKISGGVRGGHEMCADAIDVEHRMIGISNSWGIGWGNRGRCVMSFATLATLMARRGDVLAPTRKGM